MNREIKFRTWYAGNMHFWGITNPEPKRGTWQFTPPIDILAPQMQYTGLNDKNGKEIYEGDILRGHSPDDDYDNENDDWAEKGYLTTVVFEAGAFVVDASTGDYDKTAIGWAMEADFFFEVIGNVWENLELLTP